MPIDPRLRVDIDRYHAMNRLREIRERLVIEQKRNEEKRDFIWRCSALVAIFWLVYYAYTQL
jgi:hypothetical protein